MVLKPILGTNSKSHLSLLSAQPNKPRRNQDRLKDRRHPTVVIHRKNLRSLSMESSSSSSSSTYSLSYWDYVTLFLLRPVLAIVFVLSLISLGNYFSLTCSIRSHPPRFFTNTGFRITFIVFERNQDLGRWRFSLWFWFPPEFTSYLVGFVYRLVVGVEASPGSCAFGARDIRFTKETNQAKAPSTYAN